jgi:hypothetical protein
MRFNQGSRLGCSQVAESEDHVAPLAFRYRFDLHQERPAQIDWWPQQSPADHTMAWRGRRSPTEKALTDEVQVLKVLGLSVKEIDAGDVPSVEWNFLEGNCFGHRPLLQVRRDGGNDAVSQLGCELRRNESRAMPVGSRERPPHMAGGQPRCCLTERAAVVF